MKANEKAEFYKRTRDLIPYETLGAKTALVVGLGSGGSRVAVSLGRLGVQLILVERPGERLQLHNVVRHALGSNALGKLKVAEMARLISRLNPDVRTECHQMDVTMQTQAFGDLVKRRRPNLILVCTDNEQSKHVIDKVAVQYKIQTCGAGVYDGGVGGEVYRTAPGTACYGCIADFLHLRRETPTVVPQLDYIVCARMMDYR